MSSFTDYFEQAVLDLVFDNTNISNLGDATGVQGSTGAGSLYIALFTADPTDAGTQTSECTVTGYSRQAVARDGVAWTRTGSQVSNANTISFGPGTAGSEVITHFGIMDAAAAGNMLAHSNVTTSRTFESGVTLEYGAGTLTIDLA